ncbi:MAG: hypothetical protein BGO26_16915 [Actinobacteria bacterium 69-20]|nr:MAG: hypothetical protein BGO26_16915 [Actinobacteria bacterium 69-20]
MVSRRPPVEGLRALAASRSAEFGDHRVRKVHPAATFGQGRTHDLVSFDSQLARIQQAVQHLDAARARYLVGATQNPVHLDNCHEAQITRVRLGQILDEGRRDRGLPWIILNEVADNDVGVEPDHRTSVAPAAMASFMSATVTGRVGGGTEPFKSLTDAD